jgi:sulfite reductase beta subunit-like hemoprotein
VNRRQARLKYLIRDRGIEWFRAEFGRRVSFDVAPPRVLPRPAFHDYLGPHPQQDGRHFYGVFVENGRVRDWNGARLRTALRAALQELAPNVVLTPNQNLLVTDLTEPGVARFEQILREHGVRRLGELSNVRRYSMACPALPTCGLALTESERIMPDLVDQFEQLLAELGLEGELLTLRMTGCPNGCARPYTADIGLVGRKPGQRYNVYIGGGLAGDRMADLYAEDVHIDDVTATLRPLLAEFAARRRPDESFSDFFLRLTGRAQPNDMITGKETEMRHKIALPVLE